MGCKACMEACPFGVMQFNTEKGVAEKCSLSAITGSTEEKGRPASISVSDDAFILVPSKSF